MDISELQALPIAEKMEVIGKLWDDIVESGVPIELSPVVIAEINRRRAELDAVPDVAIDRDEMWRRVNESRPNHG